VFYIDVAKVHQDIAYAVNVSDAYCKHLFKVFYLFQMYIASVLIKMLHMFHTYVARVCSKCFSCFILMFSKCFHVKSVLSRCYSYFTYMLQVCVPNISSASYLCCKCFMFQRYVHRVMRGPAPPRARARGAASREPTDGAHGTPRILRTRHACPYPGS
jgi:hypothetical protein